MNSERGKEKSNWITPWLHWADTASSQD